MNTSCHYMVKKLDQQSCAKFDTFDIKGGGADGWTNKYRIHPIFSWLCNYESANFFDGKECYYLYSLTKALIFIVHTWE